MTDPTRTLIAALLDHCVAMSASKEATEDGWREPNVEPRGMTAIPEGERPGQVDSVP